MTDAQAKMVEAFARLQPSLLYQAHGLGFIMAGSVNKGMPRIVLEDVVMPDLDWRQHRDLVRDVKTIRIELQRYRIEVPHQRTDISAYVEPGHRDAVDMLIGSWSRALADKEYRERA